MPPPVLTPGTYCRNDPISGRWVGIDALLSEYQCDYNFYNHDTRIAWLESNYNQTVSIGAITQPSIDSLLITMTDSSTRGPFPLPVAGFNWRGTWQPLTPYSKNDVFQENGAVYLVLAPHTSASTFDPGAFGGTSIGNLYAEMLALPGSSLPAGGAVRMNLKKSLSADYAVTWGFDLASDTIFSPSTASGLTSTNVSAALEEIEAKIATEISAIIVNAFDVVFTPSTASSLTATNVADALDELGAAGGGGGSTTLHGLTDVLVTEGSGINNFPLYWNNGGGAWEAKALTSGSGVQKGDGSGWFAAATAGTDYLAPPSGTALLKANSGGALANATAGTDYLAPPSGTSILKGNSGGALANATAGVDYGFANVPQNSKSAAYTAVLGDAGGHLLHPAADTTARTFTIDSNANVAYVIGTTLTFVNQHGAGSLTIAITSDTMRLAGAGTTGSRTLAADGIATALKITSTEWIISGTGLT